MSKQESAPAAAPKKIPENVPAVVPPPAPEVASVPAPTTLRHITVSSVRLAVAGVRAAADEGEWAKARQRQIDLFAGVLREIGSGRCTAGDVKHLAQEALRALETPIHG